MSALEHASFWSLITIKFKVGCISVKIRFRVGEQSVLRCKILLSCLLCGFTYNGKAGARVTRVSCHCVMALLKIVVGGCAVQVAENILNT